MDVVIKKNIEEELDCISINSLKKKEEFLEIVKEFVILFKPDHLKFLESSGSSIVIFPSNIEFVYQYYVSNIVYNKICELYFNLHTYNIIYVNNIVYDVNDYLVQPRLLIDHHNAILWDKIKTLNSFDKEYLKFFIIKNIKKILWDISKALTGIHNSGFSHGDCTIDNIAINDIGNFCLFDFDSSSKNLCIYNHNNYNCNDYNDYNDFRILFKSIGFHINNEKFYSYISEDEFNLGENVFKKLSSYEESKINVLDSIKILY
jgi:hypothetical protein